MIVHSFFSSSGSLPFVPATRQCPWLVFAACILHQMSNINRFFLFCYLGTFDDLSLVFLCFQSAVQTLGIRHLLKRHREYLKFPSCRIQIVRTNLKQNHKEEKKKILLQFFLLVFCTSSKMIFNATLKLGLYFSVIDQERQLDSECKTLSTRTSEMH